MADMQRMRDAAGSPEGAQEWLGMLQSLAEQIQKQQLLATDGTSHGELARTTAVDMANSTDSELHVVAVAPGYTSYDASTLQVVVEQVRKQRRRSSITKSRRLCGPGTGSR